MINEVELNDINASSISVIMVSYMTGPVLFEAIKHVILDTKISELIIIDNGNPEQVREKLFLLVKSYGHIKVKTGHGNIGFSKGCNYGAKFASGNYLLFLNPDALITKNSATKLMNLGKANQLKRRRAKRLKKRRCNFIFFIIDGSAFRKKINTSRK